MSPEAILPAVGASSPQAVSISEVISVVEGGFAVGAGDADPWSRSTGALVIHTQLPCENPLMHGDATALGFQHDGWG